ncbi:hypothetical protein [Leucobacter denitrificans]|uniref:Uncharacterized protein n=1 Tax=Leucobacter denitrificans TaxID=683042 RepID=A0A7G9S6B8_9MICO|nr:hypothetical protein [Leucobacter denitrificans]QNN63393.1 hypothetical protein H9L06_03465 [Leucobacter denitrificans]
MQIMQAIPFTPLAVLAYLATVTVGTLSLRGRRINRRWHTALFVVTAALTVVAIVAAVPAHWVRAALLVVALVPLALLPFVTTPVRRHTARHAAVGLSAAPCYLAALGVWISHP